MKEAPLDINRRQYLELQNIGLEAFLPLNGFMKEEEFVSVVETMRLPGNDVFPLPVVLDVDAEQAKDAEKAEILNFRTNRSSFPEAFIKDCKSFPLPSSQASRKTSKNFHLPHLVSGTPRTG